LFKILGILLLFTTLAFSKVYYSKVQPYEIRDISSNVSGEVIFTDENMIGKKLSKKAFIKIDDVLNRDELKSVKEKITYLKATLETDKQILKNLEEALKRKKVNFKSIESLSIKSKVEKDREFYELINSENSYLATQKEINSLKTNISDLLLKEKQLSKMIHDKNITADGFVLYTIKVKPGSVVNIGTPLASVADVHKALLTIYLDEDDLKHLNQRVLYINDKKSNYKISRVSKIADTKNISRYKAQVIINAPKIFSQVVKIELKKDADENK